MKSRVIRVFLSWSGGKSRKLASALYEWLPDVHHYVRPWLSTEEIRKGEQWSHSVRKAIKRSEFGILCITPKTLSRPWLLFEAGALSDTAVVCSYLLGVKPSELTESPLGLFQLTQAKKKDTFRLLLTMNETLGKDAIPEKSLQRNFERLWPALRARLRELA